MSWSGIGHEKQKKHFERLIADEDLAHVYVLAGPEMVGKRMMAEDIANELLSDVSDGMHLAPERDQETGKVRDIPIEETRKLRSWIFLRPTGAHKVVIIDDADRLGGEAANNLLKILEEPPAYAHFLLVTSRPGQVMATIASRCERMDFNPLTSGEMDTVLKKFKLGTDDVKLISTVAAGKPGLATRLIEDKQLPKVARAITGFVRLLKSGIAEKIIASKNLADDEQAPDIVSWWLAWTHAQLASAPQLAPVAHGLLDLSDVLSEPQYNRRLAIEHFFLSLPMREYHIHE